MTLPLASAVLPTEPSARLALPTEPSASLGFVTEPSASFSVPTAPSASAEPSFRSGPVRPGPLRPGGARQAPRPGPVLREERPQTLREILEASVPLRTSFPRIVLSRIAEEVTEPFSNADDTVRAAKLVPPSEMNREIAPSANPR